MLISNKQELQEIAFNHSLDIKFKDFMNLYKKCTTKPYSFLVINLTTFVSDNRSHFRTFQKEYKNYLRISYRGKILTSDRRQIIEQAKFVQSPFAKAFKNQTEKQVGGLKSLDLSKKKHELKQTEGIFPKNMLNDLIINKLKEIIKLQDIIKTDELYFLVIILTYCFHKTYT